jgi:hypothetical protein
MNRIDEPLVNLTKIGKEKTQSSKIRNEKGEITKKDFLEGNPGNHQELL